MLQYNDGYYKLNNIDGLQGKSVGGVTEYFWSFLTI